MNGLQFEMDRKWDLISLGRVGIDIYPNEENRPLEEVSTYSMHIGGSPANTTFGVAKLGMRTGFIGKIKEDQLTKLILRSFREVGIDTMGLVMDHSSAVTQIAIAEVESSTKSSVLLYRNGAADLNLEPDDVAEMYIAQARLLHISGTALSASPSREAVFTAIEYAKKHQVVISMDLDYRPYIWKSDKEASIYYRLAAEKCDILFGTREEFDVVGLYADYFLKQSAKVVVIKHGQNGSVIYARSDRKCQGGIYQVDVVNTMGAGDSYASAFLYGLLHEYDLETCMRYGAGSSAIVVSQNDCTDALPDLEELEMFINTHDLTIREEDLTI